MLVSAIYIPKSDPADDVRIVTVMSDPWCVDPGDGNAAKVGE